MAGNDNLILLFGMPRSGTTWIGKTFDSHPDTTYRHEPDSIARMDSFFPLFPEQENFDQCGKELNAYIGNVSKCCSVRVCGKRPLFRKRNQTGLSFKLNELRISMQRIADILTRKELQWQSNSVGLNQRVVWKSIESGGRMGVLLTLFPSFKGIYILRHPCGYTASVLRGESRGAFGNNSSSADDWGMLQLLLETKVARNLDINMKSLRKMNSVQRLAWKWTLFNENVFQDLSVMNNATIVKYEDLCTEPIVQYKSLFEFAELDWNPQADDFVSRSTHQERGGYYSVFKNPLQTANRWKIELRSDQILDILQIAEKSIVGKTFYGD